MYNEYQICIMNIKYVCAFIFISHVSTHLTVQYSTVQYSTQYTREQKLGK